MGSLHQYLRLAKEMMQQITAEFVSLVVCLGKLFCSIFNQRLMEHVASLNILHNSQIGFLPNNRKADHVLTLRTLIDKYAHCHQEKKYTPALSTLGKFSTQFGMMGFSINC